MFNNLSDFVVYFVLVFLLFLAHAVIIIFQFKKHLKVNEGKGEKIGTRDFKLVNVCAEHLLIYVWWAVIGVAQNP
ncbi:MAG: hypothetical protein HWN65_14220 [Candidatus Helarchaeota archaeon]|nr:hypothetical protein [Candidatus Helarchaeota archaeon]